MKKLFLFFLCVFGFLGAACDYFYMDFFELIGFRNQERLVPTDALLQQNMSQAFLQGVFSDLASMRRFFLFDSASVRESGKLDIYGFFRNENIRSFFTLLDSPELNIQETAFYFGMTPDGSETLRILISIEPEGNRFQYIKHRIFTDLSLRNILLENGFLISQKPKKSINKLHYFSVTRTSKPDKPSFFIARRGNLLFLSNREEDIALLEKRIDFLTKQTPSSENEIFTEEEKEELSGKNTLYVHDPFIFKNYLESLGLPEKNARTPLSLRVDFFFDDNFVGINYKTNIAEMLLGKRIADKMIPLSHPIPMIGKGEIVLIASFVSNKEIVENLFAEDGNVRNFLKLAGLSEADEKTFYDGSVSFVLSGTRPTPLGRGAGTYYVFRNSDYKKTRRIVDAIATALTKKGLVVEKLYEDKNTVLYGRSVEPMLTFVAKTDGTNAFLILGEVDPKGCYETPFVSPELEGGLLEKTYAMAYVDMEGFRYEMERAMKGIFIERYNQDLFTLLLENTGLRELRFKALIPTEGKVFFTKTNSQ